MVCGHESTTVDEWAEHFDECDGVLDAAQAIPLPRELAEHAWQAARMRHPTARHRG